jgi:hypothetical protein
VPAPKNEDWIHLFTSTIRPLYISDALDLLASPAGSIIRFRYEQSYVEPGLQKQWETKNGLRGKRVLVHFAIQHPAEYHLPSYIPIREATVTGNFVEGHAYVINFSTGPIRLSAQTRQVVDTNDGNAIGAPVRTYSEQLRDRLHISDPPRPSAIISNSQADLLEPTLDSSGDLEVSQGADFERVVKVFSQALYFSPRIFYRVARVTTTDQQESIALQDGRLVLTAGQRYEVSIAHYQTQVPVGGTNLKVEVPPGLSLIGDPELPLASRYDVIPVELYAEYRDDRTEGQLSISVSPPALGPTVHIPVVIKPSTAASVVAPSVGIAAGVATAVSSILVTTQGVKIGLVAGGTAIAGVALMYRRARRLS